VREREREREREELWMRRDSLCDPEGVQKQNTTKQRGKKKKEKKRDPYGLNPDVALSVFSVVLFPNPREISFLYCLFASLFFVFFFNKVLIIFC
jgi:hypothetical protein